MFVLTLDIDSIDGRMFVLTAVVIRINWVSGNKLERPKGLSTKKLKEKTMHHMTHNYMLGLAVLVSAFIFFYVPMVYAFIAICKQQRK